MNKDSEIVYHRYKIKRVDPYEVKEGRGILFIVSTPIGNLDDITLRALAILNEVNIIVCEDTRHSYKILQHFKKGKRIISYHKFNERKKLNEIINYLKEGNDVALITDAGTPGISDPGHILIKEAINNDIRIEAIPGASAAIVALTLSGFNPTPFLFAGYLPKSSKKRIASLAKYKNFIGTIVFFESPNRVVNSLKDIDKIYAESQISLIREMTKIHQEILRGNALEILNTLSKRKIKGEITILINNSLQDSSSKVNTEIFNRNELINEYKKLLANGLGKNEALKILAQMTGLAKKLIYETIFIEKKL